MGEEGPPCIAPNTPPATCRYQLTHDYLVPSLRKWLTRKQRETRRGRAELKLVERAAQWASRSENRYLPTALEDLSVRLLTRHEEWTESQRRMMHKSGRWHGMRTLAVVGMILAVPVTSVVIRNDIQAERRRIEAENLQKQNATHASGLVTAVMKADIQQVPAIVKQIGNYRQWTDPILKSEYEKFEDDSPEKLKIAFALLPVDSRQVDYLYNRLLEAEPTEVVVVRDALLPHRKQLVDRLWGLFWGIDSEAQVDKMEAVDGVSRLDRADTAEGIDGLKQLRAACALAVMDDNSLRWQEISNRVVRQLVHVRPAFVTYWQQALRPVKRVLSPSLAEACHDPTLTSTERALATDLLADYAANAPEVLADAIQYADDDQFGVFFPLLEAKPTSAVPVLESCLAENPAFNWHDSPLDPAWKTPDASVVQKIQDAHGRLMARFAFCQTLPLTDFLNVAESLRECGYRPTRFRPYYSGEKEIHVSAIWARDTSSWRTKIGTVDEIRSENRRLQADKWQAVDIAGFMAPDADGKSSLLFAALWNQEGDEAPARKLLVGLPAENWSAVRQFLDKAELRRVNCYNASTTPEGKTLISVICSKNGSHSFAYNEIGSGYSGELRPGLLQVDVGVGRSPKRESTQQRYTRQLETAEQAIAAEPDDISARLRHFIACYRLGKNEQALDDMDRIFATQKNVSARSYHQRRSLILARLGKKQEAEKELAEFQKLSTSDGEKAFVKTVVAAHLGTGDTAMERLEQEVAQHKRDMVFLIWAARAYSVVSGIVHNPDKRAAYVEKAIDLIQKGIAEGFENYAGLTNDSNLEPLETSPRFVKLLKKYGLDRRYTGVWIESMSFESTEVHGLSPPDQLARSIELIEQGYRPVSIAACNLNTMFDSARILSDSPNSLAPANTGLPELETATVWHRPLIPEETKETLAKRQANAAVTLLNLNKPSSAWPILRHAPDSRTRSYLIHRMRPLHVDPQILAERFLDSSEEISIRQALALALGEFAADQLAASKRDGLLESLLNIYRNHPDPGLHAAVRWLLCHWGHKNQVSKLDARIQETEAQLAARKPTDRRQWYVTTQGHTMVVIQGGSFLMGSPLTDLDRLHGETRYRRDVDRRFALAATEVTRAQWRKFQQAHPEETNDVMKMPEFLAVVLTEDSPVVAVSWYESAAYCNWLSKQEGIPEEQWCYVRNADGKFAAGMRPKPNYLLLNGYRLPSEAEWEYACRAGATTSRYFGHTDELLTDYAWYMANSNHHAWPTGTLKPNDFGLFDMHGNANEWCHGRWTKRGNAGKDVGDAAPVQIAADRAARGGSFVETASLIRSASALGFRPDAFNYATGFRVARTYH